MELVKALTLVSLIGVMLSGSHGSCPDYRKSHCKVHPCAARLCGPGETCVADFCGGCTATCEPIPGSCVHTDGKRYEDGAKFPAGDGCNTCHCNKGEIGCTEAACVDVCKYNGKTYKVGESFPSTDGCNKCTCGKGGRVGCTKIHCPCPPHKPQVYCFINPCVFRKCGFGKQCVSDYCGGCIGRCEKVATCKYEDGKTYLAGNTFPSVDGCNECTCTDLGGVSCTRKACPPKICKYGGKSYSVGDRFPSTDGCNQCFCTGKGLVGCTRKFCLPKSCKYNGQKYRHGEKFADKDGCNTCSCDNGEVTCTGEACVTQCKHGNETYSAGESFPAGDGCNVCACRDDGNVICTLVQCLPKSCKYNGKKYEHGEKFADKDGCNTCSCDNGAVRCTEKACVPVCPLRKCLGCPNGYKKDKNGCQTCECVPAPSCKKQTCKKDQFCNGSECCPKWVLVTRCSDPCKKRRCDRLSKCERYCGCFSRCVRK